MKKRNTKVMFPSQKAKPENTPQGHADQMAKSVFNLVDSGLAAIATLDNEGVPYLAIMMKAELWTLAGKRFVLKQEGMKPDIYSR